MLCNFTDMKRKEVVNINTGAKYGTVSDFVIDTKNAQIISLSVSGKNSFFALFKKEEDYLLNWDDIATIGADVILVKNEPAARKNTVRNYFKKFFI